MRIGIDFLGAKFNINMRFYFEFSSEISFSYREMSFKFGPQSNNKKYKKYTTDVYNFSYYQHKTIFLKLQHMFSSTRNGSIAFSHG